MEIRRKPVPASSPTQYGVVQRPLTPNPRPPPHPLQNSQPPTSLQPPHSIPRYRSHPNLGASYHAAATPAIPRAETSIPASSEKPSFYEDTRHFLGGLIHHPSESTKHYSILRHSPGVIFYRGPTTSVTVSIFADTRIPADRSLWLQPKGWTGKTGMRAKAVLHLHDDWINIPPPLALRADQVEPATERAWQRDISKFRKKAAARIRDTHRLRETVVARIPADAGDGYFQLVLCHGQKKVLCRSPVFRLFSTSKDPSSVRGASLASMPLEVGALVLGSYARTAAQTVLAPVTTAAQSAVAPYKPGWLKQTAATTVASTAYSCSGLADRIARDTADPNIPDTAQPSLENGPQPPFPIEFTARPTHALDASRIALKIPSDVEAKFHGGFFGWARCASDHPWQAVIFSMRTWDAAQTTGPVSLSQTTRKVAALRFLDDPVPTPLPATINLRVLGFLRPDIAPPPPRTERELVSARQTAAEAAVLAEQCDMECARGILEHPLWGPDSTSSPKGWMERTKEGYENVRTRGWKMAERVGVRSGLEHESGGGFYIVRD
ncbi:hypothetical protein P175DRAFT_0500923 [Aspergillus ochraceoroseus IBT 24754]|uniref:LipA and NB-ARC domain protein n=2 Tax=Aspergillus ochraceoroseus TaxID=138278 RepID=A0A2T5M0L8_9EURO|nr:uncharacterized protein P175DRAFT_0500923 [Aspergillus ochraceoroseus IBT 24754]KKK19642.1 hypothetical protein AOCH_000905 [Aspergillus ochraceoroseus]PTU22069.1 hypothetical protein P175DRAFT_0500923 [Aspergillus ochraceoroseus IBT 24754]